jgi:hypothetical protein
VGRFGNRSDNVDKTVSLIDIDPGVAIGQTTYCPRLHPEDGIGVGFELQT